MDIVISGASGFIGRALTASLVADGHRVVPLVRPGGREVPADSLRWDPARATIDAAGLEGVDALVNLSGAGIGDAKWTPARKEEILESRTVTTGLLAHTLATIQTPPPVFVTASAIGYFGDRGEETCTEESAPGSGFLAEVCLEWEDAARPAAEAGLRVVWARTGIVLDPAGGVLKALLLPFRLGLGGRLGSGRQVMSWISLADEVAALRACIDEPGLGGPVDLTAPNPVTNAEFTATLGKVLGRPTALPTPLLPLKLRYGAELVQALMLDGQRVVPEKLLGHGFTFAHPDLEGALRAMLGK
ncbi:MAG: TIGR01777 family oxidoreductase [Actinomycetes bacterium]